MNALAVASEPYIFWKGDGAKEIIDKIQIPQELGKLIPADKRFNGPSGKALDDLFLTPLGYSRHEAWLCDLIPYTRFRDGQQNAIQKHYIPFINKYNLPNCTIPYYKEIEFNNRFRKDEIVNELEQSKADTIITLGDSPIKYFLSYFSEYKKLSEYGRTSDEYGKKHSIRINSKSYQVIPLVHPRQAAALGRSSFNWNKLHEKWIHSGTNLKSS